MVRKVASLLRERNELDRRLANVTGGAASPDELVAWLSEEFWGVRTPPGGVIGVFAAGPLAGRSVASVWVGSGARDQAAPANGQTPAWDGAEARTHTGGDVAAPAERPLEKETPDSDDVAISGASADYVLEYLTVKPGLSVERVRLIGRDGGAAEVFPQALSPLEVDEAAAEGLRALSSRFVPPLTRYH